MTARSERTRRELQRLRDEIEQRQRALAEDAQADPPAPGWVREQPSGNERPATETELREADRLLAKHRRWVKAADTDRKEGARP